MFRAPSRRGTGQALASRIGAFLFLGGAGLTVLAPLLPHPEQMDIAGFMAIAALQVLAAAIILTLPDRLRRSPWVPGLIVVVESSAGAAA